MVISLRVTIAVWLSSFVMRAEGEEVRGIAVSRRYMVGRDETRGRMYADCLDQKKSSSVRVNLVVILHDGTERIERKEQDSTQ